MPAQDVVAHEARHRREGTCSCLSEPEAIDWPKADDDSQSQVRRFGRVLNMILLGPGEVFVLIIITAVVVLLAVRGRNIK